MLCLSPTENQISGSNPNSSILSSRGTDTELHIPQEKALQHSLNWAGGRGITDFPHKQNSHLCITRKLVLREEVSTDCNRVITKNFSSTHPEHQEHREWKDPVSWRSSSHSTHNSQGKNFTILLPCIFTTALFSVGSIKPSCTQDHS